MPHEPLPERLVTRFKKAAHRLQLGKMKPIDPRVDPKRSPAEWQRGGRVREVRLRPDTSHVPVVIKRVHGRFTAPKLIDFIRKKVYKYNLHFAKHDPRVRNIDYELHIPNAYAISDSKIVMAKTMAPTLQEVLDQHSSRAKQTVEKWKESGLNVSRLLTHLQYVGQDIALRVDIRFDNLFVIVSENGKIDLYPIPDEF